MPVNEKEVDPGEIVAILFYGSLRRLYSKRNFTKIQQILGVVNIYGQNLVYLIMFHEYMGHFTDTV